MMDSVERRIRELATVTAWSSDIRVNMTRVVGALRAAIKKLDEKQAEVEQLLAEKGIVEVQRDAARQKDNAKLVSALEIETKQLQKHVVLLEAHVGSAVAVELSRQREKECQTNGGCRD